MIISDKKYISRNKKHISRNKLTQFIKKELQDTIRLPLGKKQNSKITAR